MDDLRTLGSVLSQDEPSQDVVDRSRHRLLNHMRGDRPVRRRVWLPMAAALTAAAAVAAVALVAVPSTGTEPAAASGQDVLLAAATAAEQSPEGSGTYWHLTIKTPSVEYPIALECWTMPNGRAWYRNSGTDYAVWPSAAPPNTFALTGGVNLTLDQLRALPASPDALREWVDAAVQGGVKQYHEQASPDSLVPLVSLVSTVPAPPGVRAAAFRAIAEYPGIKNLGDVPGGEGVLLPGDTRLVVDLAAGRVNGVSDLVVMGMGYVVTRQGDVTITAEWTDKPPL